MSPHAENPEGALAEASTLSGLSFRSVPGRGPNSAQKSSTAEAFDGRSLIHLDPKIAAISDALPVSREVADPKTRRSAGRPTIPKDPRSVSRTTPSIRFPDAPGTRTEGILPGSAFAAPYPLSGVPQGHPCGVREK